MNMVTSFGMGCSMHSVAKRVLYKFSNLPQNVVKNLF